MNDRPDPFNLLTASLRDDPGRWLPLGDHAMDAARVDELTQRIAQLEEPLPQAERNQGDRGHVPSTGRPTRRRALTAAAAVIVLIASATVLATRTPSAEAVVRSASTDLRTTRSLKAQLARTTTAGKSATSLVAAGDTFHLRTSTQFTDGRSEASEQTYVDGYLYERVGETTTRTPAEPERLPAPFAQSSAAIIEAAATGADIAGVAATTRDGTAATRYDIALTPKSRRALSRLQPNQLAWFELENPDQVELLQLWIVDDEVREVRARSDATALSITFQRPNTPSTITAPPPPYNG